jgi:S-adenosylmethionine uptake transporter
VRAPVQAAWAVGSALAFAGMSAAIKVGFAHYGLFELVFWRNALGAVAVAGWALATGRRIATPHLPLHLRRSAAGCSAMVLWFVALAHLPLPTAATLGNTSPLFVAVAVAVAARLRGLPSDGTRGRLYLAAALGFAGVLLALRPTMDGAGLAGFAAGLGSGLLASLVFFEMRSLGAVGEPSWRVVLWFSTVASLVGLAGIAATGGFSPHTAAGVGWLAAIAGLALIGQLCMTRAFAGPATLLAANLQYTNIGFAAVIGWIAFDDALSARESIGIATIVAAGAYATWVTARAMPGTQVAAPDPVLAHAADAAPGPGATHRGPIASAGPDAAPPPFPAARAPARGIAPAGRTPAAPEDSR